MHKCNAQKFSFPSRLMLNLAFAPRSLLQPYSIHKPLASTVSRIILVLASSSHPIQTKSKATRIVLKPLRSGQKQYFCKPFLKTALCNPANWLVGKPAKKLVYQRILCRRKTSQTFFPAQTKLCNLEYSKVPPALKTAL